DVMPHSAQGEMSIGRQEQARKSCSRDGAGECRRRGRPKRIIELEATGELASGQIEIQRDSCGAGRCKSDVDGIVGESPARQQGSRMMSGTPENCSQTPPA